MFLYRNICGNVLQMPGRREVECGDRRPARANEVSEYVARWKENMWLNVLVPDYSPQARAPNDTSRKCYVQVHGEPPTYSARTYPTHAMPPTEHTKAEKKRHFVEKNRFGKRPRTLFRRQGDPVANSPRPKSKKRREPRMMHDTFWRQCAISESLRSD